MQEPREKPLVIFDGQCGFCRRSVESWRAGTAERVEYAPFQEVAEQFPEIPRREFEGAVQLIDVNGLRYSGAEAVFRVMNHVPGKEWWLKLYRHMPGFAPVSHAAYQWIASHRSAVSSISWWLWGKHVGPSTYFVSRQLFLRLLGLIYFVAFVSFGVQAAGLVGEQGIVPVKDLLVRAHARQTGQPYSSIPTLCWLSSSDFFLKWVLCGGGALFSLFLTAGYLPKLMLFLLWLFYLSLVWAGQVFMSFQWDSLLLEAGLLAVFYAPRTWHLASAKARPPSKAFRFLIVWLLFRLMFESGVVKLTAGDPAENSWRNLTALTYHYETQPLAPWTAWYAHHLPLWFHKMSIVLMFVAELAAPLVLFAPRRLRHAACAIIVGLMAVIGATGNYNFFNLLTVVLCVAVVDDAMLRRFTPKGTFDRWMMHGTIRTGPVQTARMVVVGAFTLAVVAYTTIDGVQRSAGNLKIPEWVARTGSKMDRIRSVIGSFRSINSYGLFRNMTQIRPEIVIEGSADGRTWKEYEFRWKPGDVSRIPRFAQPHQPRLDWQMWFAALSRYERQYWFQRLLQELLEGNPVVLDLLGSNPFPEVPPRYVRAQLYRYEFSDRTGLPPGAWWKRTYVRPYSPTLSAPQ